MRRSKKVVVNDKMQKQYRYVLTEPIGRNFDSRFKPELTPKQMLSLGVFGGVYMRDCAKEFPSDWFVNAKFQKNNNYKRNPKINFFGVNASQSLSTWRKNAWIHPQDPRGWFQWYCRYYMGRRSEDDERQIKRWIAMRRHVSQIVNNCRVGDYLCRRKQRQAVLHWAYDSRKM